MTDRLIYAEKLKRHYAWWENGSEKDKLDRAVFDTIINLQPTVEAVEVVRCEECKHFDKNCSCVGGTYEGCLVLDGVDGSPMNVEPDFFCAYGERKTKGEPRND